MLGDWHYIPLRHPVRKVSDVRTHDNGICGGAVVVHTGMSKPISLGDLIEQGLNCKCERCGADGVTFVDDRCIDFEWHNRGKRKEK